MKVLMFAAVLILTSCSNPPPTQSILTCKIDGDTVYTKTSKYSWMYDKDTWRTRDLNNYYKPSLFESCKSENFYD